MQEIKGILNIKKHSGITSFGAVKSVRKTLGVKKVGHGGTLDPPATGVLLLLIGEATKIQSYLPDEKEYEGVMVLGEETSTQDATGRLIRKVDDPDIPERLLKESSRSFTGKIEQIPPMVSAKHFQGRRLYELYYIGKEVERKPQEVFVKSLEILEYSPPRVRIRVVCSGGTYIRTLVHDWGHKLGCGAHLESLVRKRIGNFHIEDALPLSQSKEEFLDAIQPMEYGLSSWGRLIVKEWLVKQILQGGSISDSGIDSLVPSPVSRDIVTVLNQKGSLIALAKRHHKDWRILRVFNQQ